MRQKAWRRLPVWAGVLGFSALVLLSGMDRLADAHGLLVRTAPLPLAAAAHRAQAAEALRAQDPTAAIAAARRAVRADPVDPRSAALLGAALFSAGQHESAHRSFRLAARTGWRDPVTQLYFMEQALRGAEWNRAALRLDAVLRQDPAFPLRDMLLARFEASAPGRAALVQRLALRPAWLAPFIGSDLPATALLNRARVLETMRGPVLGCAAIGPLVGRLISAGSVPAAKNLWTAHCRRASAAIADPGFAGLGEVHQPTPFDWNPVLSGDIALQPNAPAGSGVAARTSAASSRAAAWQLLTLAPGRYRLGWAAKTRSGDPSQTVFFTFACRPGEGMPLRSAPLDGKRRYEAMLHVDGRCAGQYLTMWLSPGGQDILVGPLSLKPAF